MATMRKPFQGVGNIIRFNWHFYLIAVVLISLLFFLSNSYLIELKLITNIFLSLIFLNLAVSLLVSWYIYDRSDWYELNFLNELKNPQKILNINAGFDETSVIIQSKFPDSELVVFDFYDENKHTENSIKRARKAYPAYPGTVQIETEKMPENDAEFDLILNILSAHEIRNEKERIHFFREQKRVLRENGKIIVTEHLRDLPNFLAYTIGFFHFHSKKIWLKTFEESGLGIEQEIKITPFISTFILKKNGISS